MTRMPFRWTSPWSFIGSHGNAGSFDRKRAHQTAARRIALQMLEERGRGAVLVERAGPIRSLSQ